MIKRIIEQEFFGRDTSFASVTHLNYRSMAYNIKPKTKAIMETFTNGLLAKMHAALQNVAAETDNQLQQAEKSFYIVESAIRDLKDFIAGYEFKDTLEEIRFFKEIKPEFLKELIYYSELYHIEGNLPFGSGKSEKRYYKRMLESISRFFEKNRILYNYYLMGKSDMDEIYYLRQTAIIPLLPEYTPDLDSSFSTPHSNCLAQLMAFEQLKLYLNAAIKKEPANETPDHAQRKKPAWVWKVAAVSLIEVGYALWKSGAISHGPGGFKQFMVELASFFNVKVGNVYRVILGMSYRKKGRTPFLTYLVNVTERTFDEKDI